jgi:hypothetical protein
VTRVTEATRLRPLLFSIAYRILGSVAEAEDAVQRIQSIRLVLNPQKLGHVGPVADPWEVSRVFRESRRAQP